MPFAAAIKFKENGASKFFHPAGLELERDDYVWVKDPGSNGIERMGFVSSMEGRAAIQMGHLPRVLRYAEEAEIEQWYELKIQEREMLELTRERAEAHDLPMKVSDLIFVPDKRQVLVQFTSEHRIDFRELVKDLAGHFKARIEMWQIGARKEAGLKDGYGVCGNPLCCGSWLKDFPSITMRYAKEQDIIQPPSKLSGPCGKLRCCLRYEHETYLELADGVATRGCRGCSSDGKCGVVVDRNLLKQELTLKTDEGSYVSVPAAGFEEGGAPPVGSGPGDERRGARGDERRDARTGTRSGSREEPHRWAPGEPVPESGGGNEADETVLDEPDGGISVTTGSTGRGASSRGGTKSDTGSRGSGGGESGRRERAPRTRGERNRPDRPSGRGPRRPRPESRAERAQGGDVRSRASRPAEKTEKPDTGKPDIGKEETPKSPGERRRRSRRRRGGRGGSGGGPGRPEGSGGSGDAS